MGKLMCIYNRGIFTIYLLILCSQMIISTPPPVKEIKHCGKSYINEEMKVIIDNLISEGEVSIAPGISMENIQSRRRDKNDKNETSTIFISFEDYVANKIEKYADTHILSIDLPTTARFLSGPNTGKSSFLTGFGMGFLAFGLKKLLLPFFIGAQLLKSALIAMFLPSILGGLGRLLGKGLSSFSGISGASGGLNTNNNQPGEEFDFKDNNPYEEGNAYNAEVGTSGLQSVLTTESFVPKNSRLGTGNERIAYMSTNNDHYYMRKPIKNTDYKVFNKIPPSSLMLTSYDPFYSPILSRLDAVFQQLGLINNKSPETERCRERLLCFMYANPAKYAPYSNLISVQLSRDLNELRKPEADNPEILRFFRYMKAAKDGQEDPQCTNHQGCPGLVSSQSSSPVILTTFNDINKLVQARELH